MGESTSRTTVTRFTLQYEFLSNFYPSEVELDGVLYPTVEHAYQAAKVPTDSNYRKVVRLASTAGKAKRAGRAAPLRADWESVKDSVMEDLVRQKFTRHESLAKKLMATKNYLLEEGNHWGDTYWGTCNGKGENKLGLILMKVRSELFEKSGE